MAVITTALDASIDASTAMFAPQITGLLAGEDLALCGPCYLKSSDGLVYKSNGTALNEAAEFIGISPRGARLGEAVTIYGQGTRFRVSGGTLVPGDFYFVAATAGAWDNVATIGDTVGTIQAISTTDAIVCRRLSRGS